MDSRQVENLHAAAAGATVPLEQFADQYLPELLEEVETFVREQELRLAPARTYATEIRNEIARRMDAQNTRQRKLGDFVVRFDSVAASATVRTALAAEPWVIEGLAPIVPADLLAKALKKVEIPARVEVKTHLTYLRKIANDCGPEAAEIVGKLIDEGTPRRRLVVEREQQRVQPAAIGVRS